MHASVCAQPFNPLVESLHNMLLKSKSTGSIPSSTPPQGSGFSPYVEDLHQKLSKRPPLATPNRLDCKPEFRKLMWHKEDGNVGPRAGEKAPNQLLVKAEHRGQVMALHLVDTVQQHFSWQAFKSNVREWQVVECEMGGGGGGGGGGE